MSHWPIKPLFESPTSRSTAVSLHQASSHQIPVSRALLAADRAGRLAAPMVVPAKAVSQWRASAGYLVRT